MHFSPRGLHIANYLRIVFLFFSFFSPFLQGGFTRFLPTYYFRRYENANWANLRRKRNIRTTFFFFFYIISLCYIPVEFNYVIQFHPELCKFHLVLWVFWKKKKTRNASSFRNYVNLYKLWKFRSRSEITHSIEKGFRIVMCIFNLLQEDKQ